MVDNTDHGKLGYQRYLVVNMTTGRRTLERIGLSLQHFRRFEAESVPYLLHIDTEDETRVHHVILEMNHAFMSFYPQKH
ncbi:hypothetical protein TNCT_79571 [Trichonephila clavata]|uniref:Uncharacterized protein n=1 Tax=Trichonephila clavata TaxID=2740835 RepID=A0A8X6GRY6_TRICU|nr:hypothetical protein TNCT_79571 [Trichonephila clavata]